MEQKKKIIDLSKIIAQIRKRKKRIIINVSIAFILACVWIFPEPRFYSCDVELAPEAGSGLDGGSLASIASSFGFNIGGGAQNDAIYPLLYPDLFESPSFIVGLMDIQVETRDGSIKTDYYTYMTKHQKHNVLTLPFRKVMRSVKEWVSPQKPYEKLSGDPQKLDAFCLSRDDYQLMQQVQENIKCMVDRKTNVTTIIVKDQDPLVCALLADSVKMRLQQFITEYRTSKARLDLDYYQQLVDAAYVDYEKASQAYSDYSDSHKGAILQAYISERDRLENDMSMKFQTYSAMIVQRDAAKAKVQERTPSFTTLKSVTVPVKPEGPKRMIFIFMVVLMTFIGTALYVCRELIFQSEER